MNEHKQHKFSHLPSLLIAALWLITTIAFA